MTNGSTWRRGWAVLAFVAVLLPALARGEMKYVETSQLQLVYNSPAGDYLVPYATQTLLNGLAAQHARFGYVPDGKVAVFLQDFADRGNAAAVLGAPGNRIYLELAPPILSFETFSPGERLYTTSSCTPSSATRPAPRTCGRAVGSAARSSQCPSTPSRSSTTT
jgi:hypothetical protein